MADAIPTGVTADTPLSGKSPIQIEGLAITELPYLGKITLRGDADDKAFTDAARKVLGAELPTEPMSSVQAGTTRIFWRAYDEWLIWTAAGDQTKTIADLREAMSSLQKAIVDVSDYYTVIRVSGTLSRELLAKGCLVDLHPRSFSPGQATGTGFHQATVFLTLVDGDTIDVMIRWSYADYLWEYFADGAREWS